MNMKTDNPFRTRGKFKLVVNRNVVWYCSNLEQAVYMSNRLKIKHIYRKIKKDWVLLDL